jgi:hypothetical protein
MANGGVEGSDWSGEELDLIVADYFSMLEKEARNLFYNKTEHRRTLMSRIGRNNSSIEFKHANISAVLQQLGLPWIDGYKPRANFQTAIIAAIDRYLSRTPSALVLDIEPTGLNESPQLFIEAPPTLLPSAARTEPLKRLIRKFNPVERDFRNRKLGRAGEELIFFHERRQLEQLGRTDLARKVKWVSEELGDGAGYDILSFDHHGAEKLIEVKTTLGIDTTPFYLTRNELSLSGERPDAFKLFRLYQFYRNPRMFELSPPLEEAVRIEPLTFQASFD